MDTNKETLVRIAADYAKDHGWKVDDYRAFAGEIEDGQCWVRFEGKSKLPGDHFSVVVDVSTGRATDLIPGR
ncbi:MAG: hypothetical protein ACRDI2_08900 [Chloroflexota bacterium]